MARLPRSFSVRADSCVHKIWRGHNREWNIGQDRDKAIYLEFLNQDLESKKFQCGVRVHALTLMSNHTHEIYGIQSPVHFSHHMRRHHSRYGAHFNKQNQRCGKVAQDRPKTCLIGDEHHEMIATFYAHANPVRAGIVGDAKDYLWSTHRLFAFGKRERWMRNITLPGWYMKLGKNMVQRQKQYRKRYAQYLKDAGGRKQQFLQKLFFGPAPWLIAMENEVRSWREALRMEAS